MSWNSERVCEQIHLLKGSRALRELGQDQDVIIVFLTMYMESGIIEDVYKICIVVVKHFEYYQLSMWYFCVFQDMPCFHGQTALPVMQQFSFYSPIN